MTARPVSWVQPSRRLTGLLLVAVPVLLFAWMTIWPILSGLTTALTPQQADGSRPLSFDNFVTFFSDPYSLANLGITLWTCLITLGLLLVICIPLALYLRFAQGRLATYVQTMAMFPMFVPSIILAFAFIRVLGPNGMADLLLNAVGLPKIRSPYLTPWGPVIGLVWDNIPLTVLILVSGLGAVSNQAVEAARDVGAKPLALFWHIILPRMWTSVAVVVSFTMLGLFASFTLPYVLGPASPEMMGPFMQRTFRDLRNPEMALTQATITMVFCIAFGLFYVRAVARNRGN
ncbi:ABC transporter permease [Devosia aquimaris]|uniref:ABC transporter permease n=1 Tax=Devosia aquimaris TaxID=2866214 RepID=UPI001CD185CA|nr:ABC transporter permease subunit [Devosia sp. CJK-A8-3]